MERQPLTASTTLNEPLDGSSQGTKMMAFERIAESNIVASAAFA